MNIYLAPLEGITGWIYRGAVQKCFGGFDKYFIPFIKPNQMGRFSAREKKDILPEHKGDACCSSDIDKLCRGLCTDGKEAGTVRV